MAAHLTNGSHDAELGRLPLLQGGSSNTSSPDKGSPSTSPQRSVLNAARSPAWGTGLPATFICGALVTLAVVLLTGGSVGGVRWQAAPGMAKAGVLERKAGHPAIGEVREPAAAAEAAAGSSPQCPDPPPCPEPPEPEACPACPKQQPCPKQPQCPVCAEPKEQQEQEVQEEGQGGAGASEPQAAAAEDAAEDAAKKSEDASPEQQQQQQPGKRQQQKGKEEPEPQRPTGKQQQGKQGGKPPGRPLRMPWQPLLSASEVQRGVGYYGTGGRLEAVMAKLLAGQPIRAYTLGGSVTKGSGSSSEESAYPGRFFEFIQKTFPHKDHVLVNKGVGATSSGIFSACVEQMLPDGADLVVIEFTVNEKPDVPLTDPQRRGYEQLVRKLLRMPGPPAVIQLHTWAWWRAVGEGVDEGLFYWPMTEAHLYTLSQYYDVPSVSLRAATYHLMRSRIDHFNPDALLARHRENKSPRGKVIPPAPEGEDDKYFFYDRTHPNDQGHQVLAELLANLLLQAAARVQRAAAGVPVAANDAGWAAERRDERLQGLPPPMIPDNEDAPSTLCAMQEDFKPIVVAQKGFEYKPDRPEEPTFVGQKWGWTSDKPGAWAELQIDSRPSANSASGDRTSGIPYVTVYLAHLRSYQGMGTANITCVSGCRCQPTLLDGTWEQEVSLMQNLRFTVSPAERCRIRVTVLDAPGSVPQEGHKVKLMAIMASHFPLRLDQADDQTEVVAGKVAG